MLTRRVIPCLDVHGGTVVKGVNFVELCDAGDSVQLAVGYDREGADDLVFLDITASHEPRDIMVRLAARRTEQVFIPFTVRGRLRSEEDVRRILVAGADKVSLNAAAVDDPALIVVAHGASARSESCWPSTRSGARPAGGAMSLPGRSMSTAAGRLPAGTPLSGALRCRARRR